MNSNVLYSKLYASIIFVDNLIAIDNDSQNRMGGDWNHVMIPVT
jgi:hypothetical protein